MMLSLQYDISAPSQVVLANLTIGEGASFALTVHGEMMCVNVSVPEDFIKEGLELDLITLGSNDPAVSFGRDLAVVFRPMNGGG